MNDQEEHLQKYSSVLAPVFSPKGVDAFEFACALLRVRGIQGPGWDPLLESQQVLDDLTTLTQIELPRQRFKDTEKTRWRLAMLVYAHITEMDAPYDVLANLLRVQAHFKYDMNPFRTVHPAKKHKPQLFRPNPKPSPATKISLIRKLAEQANHAEIGRIFDDFYHPELRNAINHSDYVFHDGEFRMLHGFIMEEDRGVLSPVIPLERLGRLVNRALAFYSVFFALEKSARATFAGLKGKCFPYDHHLKGLLEFLTDAHDLLCGFKVHWPNEHDSVYRRTSDGECDGMNICPNSDGSINFFVGEYFKGHTAFSELVPTGAQPRYTAAEGSSELPGWPEG